MTIAWDYLSNEQRAQLLHFRPDLKPDTCKNCGSQLLDDNDCLRCMHCSRPHNYNGELIEHPQGRPTSGGHHAKRSLR